MLLPFLSAIQQGDIKALATCISLIENQAPGSLDLLKKLRISKTPVIGITGPPGVGKSTIVNALTAELIKQQKKIAILCIDPSSPFHRGALLGDRIRMNQWSLDPGVYIRSLASRGSLGGLHPRIFEITDLLKAAPFDYIIVETVGIGQSELEISSLADLTVVILMPGSGDEIQAMKAGLMEIGDIFVVNKNDRPDADIFVRTLRQMLSRPGHETPVVKTIASEKKGLKELMQEIAGQLQHPAAADKKYRLLTERALHLISRRRMQDIDRNQITSRIRELSAAGTFNLYQFIADY